MRQYRSVLTNKSFIKWAHDHMIVLIAHNELLHEEHPAKEEGGRPECSLYPGLRCRDHLNITVETENSREEHLPRVTFVELCPNSWIIAPTGGFPAQGSSVEAPAKGDKAGEQAADRYAPFRQIPEKDQFTSKGIRKHVEAVQALLGDPLDRSTGHKIAAILKKAQTHQDESDWSGVMAALAKIDEHAKKAPLSLRRLVAARLAEVSDEIEYEFDDLKEAKNVPAVRALLKVASIPVVGQTVPIAKAMDEWVKAQK